jgi:NDP-sugar pyrophosphorylase family protein
VGGRSLLEWNLRWVLEAGSDPIWVNLHYGGRGPPAVEAMALGGRPFAFSRGPDPRDGRRLAEAGSASGTETSLVVYGDNLTRFDLARSGRRTRGPQGGGLATVALFDPASCPYGDRREPGPGVGDYRVTGFEEVRGGVAGRPW